LPGGDFRRLTRSVCSIDSAPPLPLAQPQPLTRARTRTRTRTEPDARCARFWRRLPARETSEQSHESIGECLAVGSSLGGRIPD
jgi:hypothetical protein